MRTETEAFLAEMLPKQRAAEKALHDGDVEPRLALWTRGTPVTLLGAKLTATGWDEIEPSFREVASWFSGSESYEFEVVAAGASADLAYTVGYERNVAITNGERRQYVLRATHVYPSSAEDLRQPTWVRYEGVRPPARPHRRAGAPTHHRPPRYDPR